MDMRKTKREYVRYDIHIYEIEHYRGSLDFPCDFCDSNSYDNLQFSKDEELYFVVCKDCIKKALKEK